MENLISDDVRGDIFIESLRNRMVLGDMVTMLTNLTGERDHPGGNHSTYGGVERRKRRSHREQPGYRSSSIDSTRFVRSFTEVKPDIDSTVDP